MKIWYENFWPGFDPNVCYFNDILRTITNVEITPENPDLLIYCVFGDRNVIKKYNCKICFFSSERFLVGTNPLQKVSIENYPHDFSVSYDPDQKTNIQYQFWLLYLNYDNKGAHNYYKKIVEKRTFQNKNQYCNFIYSNPAVGYSPRFDFFKFLSNKRFVHSAGRFANNIGNPIKNKLDYIKDFVFTIAFENAYDDFYITEKLLEPLLATSIPIYWGGQKSLKHFNSNTLINAYDRSFEEIENEMNELLKNKDQIIEMSTLPILEKFPEQFLPETIATKIMNQLET